MNGDRESGPRPEVGDWESTSVPAEAGGERLDRWLSRELAEPRSQVQRWIREGRVLVDRRVVRPSHAVEAGSEVRWSRPPRVDDRIVPEAGELTILFEDPDLLVVDKPAGLTVHPGAGRPTGTLVHRALAYAPELAGIGGPGRPGIVHRLDKDTSGVMVLARSPAAYRALSAAFAERRVRKVYEAILFTTHSRDRWTIDAPVGRHPQERTRMTVRSDGRPAVSHFEVVARAPGLARVRVRIETGRTHQIRVHAKEGGTPLVGDPVYGEARWKALPAPLRAAVKSFPRPALHALELAFDHPVLGDPVVITAPTPSDLSELWASLTGG